MHFFRSADVWGDYPFQVAKLDFERACKACQPHVLMVAARMCVESGGPLTGIYLKLKSTVSSQHEADMLCRYVDQGGGKRKGAFAVYLEPWHSDIFEWLDLRKNHGKEEVQTAPCCTHPLHDHGN